MVQTYNTRFKTSRENFFGKTALKNSVLLKQFKNLHYIFIHGASISTSKTARSHRVQDPTVRDLELISYVLRYSDQK